MLYTSIAVLQAYVDLSPAARGAGQAGIQRVAALASPCTAVYHCHAHRPSTSSYMHRGPFRATAFFASVEGTGPCKGNIHDVYPSIEASSIVFTLTASTPPSRPPPSFSKAVRSPASRRARRRFRQTAPAARRERVAPQRWLRTRLWQFYTHGDAHGQRCTTRSSPRGQVGAGYNSCCERAPCGSASMHMHRLLTART